MPKTWYLVYEDFSTIQNGMIVECVSPTDAAQLWVERMASDPDDKRDLDGLTLNVFPLGEKIRIQIQQKQEFDFNITSDE